MMFYIVSPFCDKQKNSEFIDVKYIQIYVARLHFLLIALNLQVYILNYKVSYEYMINIL